jgi:hypothetical protein
MRHGRRKGCPLYHGAFLAAGRSSMRNSYTRGGVNRERVSETGSMAAASRFAPERTEGIMSLSLIVLIVLVLLLVGALPTWGYSSGWGYWPSGGLGLVVLILVVLMLMGRL